MEINMINNGAITGHFIAHWGVPIAIKPMNVRGIDHFAILEFPPKGTRDSWRYATNGMSSVPQYGPAGAVDVRTEIYVATRHKSQWVETLLAAIASYPHDFCTYLSEFDTISVGRSIDSGSSCYTGILIAPPEIESLGLVAGLAVNVLVHEVVGLLPNEVKFVETNSGNVFWRSLSGHHDQLLDEMRPSVI
jgi:hypothetical protein